VVLAAGVWFFMKSRKALAEAVKAVQARGQRAKSAKDALQGGFNTVNQVAVILSAVTYFQTTVSIFHMGLHWPPVLSDAFETASDVFTVDLFVLLLPECLFGHMSFYKRWLRATFVFPAVVVVLSMVPICVSAREGHDYGTARDKSINILSTMLMLLYIGVVTNAMAPFDCVDFGTGVRAMRSNPAIVCTTAGQSVGLDDMNPFAVEEGGWKGFVVPAALSTVTFIFLVWLLWNGLRLKKNAGALDEKCVMATYGNLYLRYDQECWFWETVIFVRKSFIVVLSSVLSDHPWLQVIGSAVLFGASLALQVRFAPYLSDSIDRIEMIALSSCLALVALGACALAGLHGIAVSVFYCLIMAGTAVTMIAPVRSIWVGADDAPVHTGATAASNPISIELTTAEGAARENPETSRA
jgi:hypothetical protein